MSEGRHDAKDLALAPNEYAYVMDTTKGQVNVYTGPHKASLSQTDQPVVFNDKTKKFDEVTLQAAKKLCLVAPESWYIVLKNPATDDSKPHPTAGSVGTMPDMNVGHKVNISGPTSFSLWPGQMARLIPGHRLLQNQYLVTRVYDQKSARENWKDAVVAPQTEGVDTESPVTSLSADELTTGKLIIVKGTDVSFYIPPTGIEVVRDDSGKYVRNAVTLERLEYCLLTDQNGNKRYEYGPAVVFPEPTEQFVEGENGNRKFKAIELNPKSGIYVKVIAPYTDENSGKEFKVGDELFITGEEQAIYFPREEHALITYGKQDKHYGIAIPPGEARYVLDRNHGTIRLQHGPQIFLPDPRQEVVVRRILDSRTCSLLYPGNLEALSHNEALLQETRSNKHASAMILGDAAPVDVAMVASASSDEEEMLGVPICGEVDEEASRGVEITAQNFRKGRLRRRGSRQRLGDDFTRGTQYTPPRTVTLNTKYDGAVCVDVWEGYAIMLTSKSGERRVIQGPQTALLEYDETPHVLSLSTGKPKNTDDLFRTVYLCVRNNYVTDVIEAETKDFCTVRAKLSYRVNFVGDDPSRWFSVENYVKFLCDHMRSMVRNHVKKLTVEEFYQNNAIILRDVILGKKPEDGGPRDGRLFQENNMHIYDVEVLKVELDDRIQTMLVSQQHNAISQTLEIDKARRELQFTRENEDLLRQIAQEKAKTTALSQELRREEIAQKTQTDITNIESQTTASIKREEGKVQVQELMNQIADEELKRDKARNQAVIEQKSAEVAIDLEKMNADAEATKVKAEAISADLIAALRGFTEHETLTKFAEALGPTQLLKVAGGSSVVDIVSGLLDGTDLAEHLPKMLKKSNGKQQPHA